MFSRKYKKEAFQIKCISNLANMTVRQSLYKYVTAKIRSQISIENCEA